MISFALSDEEQALKDAVHGFARERLRPILRAAEEAGVPDAVRQEAYEMGLALMGFPEEMGGVGLSLVAQAVVQEELAWGDIGCAQALMGPGLAGMAVLHLGTAEQKERLLAPFTAKDGWKKSGALVQAGRLCWPCPADLYVVVADDVHAYTAGTATPAATRLGCLAVPAGWFLGEGGELLGTDAAGVVARARVLQAAQLAGLARAATEYATEYTSARQAFGQVIAQFQAVSFSVADMHMLADGARWTTWQAAWALDTAQAEGNRLAALALAQAAESAFFCGNWAVQLLGGHGYVFDHPVEKWMRDARALATNAGAAEAAEEHGSLLMGGVS